MLGAEVTAYWADGRPLEELSKLIQKRMKILHESSKDATVATAITVLKSLRAATRVYKGKKVGVVYG